MNRFELSGYIGIEPKIEMTSNGKKRATFTVANRVSKDKTQFIYVQAWDKAAEIVQNYGKKGEFVIIEGRLSVYERTDATGHKNSQLQCIADRIEQINTHRGEKPSQPVYQVPKIEPQHTVQPAQAAPEIDPYDLPF